MVAVGVGQPGVEPVGRVGVMPQRAHRIGQWQHAVGADGPAHLVAVDARLGGEPRRVGRQVHPERDEHQRVQRRARRRGVTCPSHGRGTRYCLRAATSNATVISPKNTTKYRPDHFVAQARPKQHAGAEPPPPHPEARAPRRLGDPALEQRDVHALADLVAVDDQAAERGDDEHRQEAVQQCGARGDEADPVGDQQQTGDAADQRGPADATRDARHQQHEDHAADRTGESPAQAVVAEDRLADRDQLLADRWVHHQPVAGVVLDAVVVHHLPGLRRVVLLVEDRGARVGRGARG